MFKYHIVGSSRVQALNVSVATCNLILQKFLPRVSVSRQISATCMRLPPNLFHARVGVRVLESSTYEW